MHITEFNKGLYTDVNPIMQPKSTYRFALNAVEESLEGERQAISNENANEIFYKIPIDTIPLGKVYIGKDRTLIFLVDKTEVYSHIGIGYKNGRYESLIISEDLNFKLTHQIDAIYRNRRGCGDTIYFVDNYNVPRVINIDKLDLYKKNGNWVVSKFALQRDYKSIPKFKNFKITSNGNISVGSYNFGILLLDEDLNPTEIVDITDTISIYKDSETSVSFSDIRGSAVNTDNTTKAIQLEISSLDINFKYYKVVVIIADSGSGDITKVLYSPEISTKQSIFTYTGSNNGYTLGNVNDILFNKVKFEKIKNISQIENRNVLSNSEGKNVNYCNLQRYVSQIKTDLILKDIVLNNTTVKNNQKREQVHNEDLGYMPGEIYAFNLHYVFEDFTFTPGFHIPGRNPTYNSKMSTDNKLKNTYYIENSCKDKKYWCVDSQGDELINTQVRHHRFPLRSEVNAPLITKDKDNSTILNQNYFYINISKNIAEDYDEDTITYIVFYKIENILKQQEFTFYVNSYSSDIGIHQFIDSSLDTITFIEVKEKLKNGSLVDPITNSKLQYTEEILVLKTEVEDVIYKSKIFGIKFSDIIIPPEKETNGKKIIGYFITRAARNENTKTILDSALITPLLETNTENRNFISHGHLVPNSINIPKDIFALIHPRFKFDNLEYSNVTSIIQDGFYKVKNIYKTKKIIEDVQPGTSYDSSIHKRREKDSDGFSLHNFIRTNSVEYISKSKVFVVLDKIKSIFYLDTLYNKVITNINGFRKDIYNLSSDNKIGILQLNEEKIVNKDYLPYVLLKRDLQDPYSDFRTATFYKEHTNIQYATGIINNEVNLFNGDSYIAPMRYTSSMFYDINIKKRRNKFTVLEYIIGVMTFGFTVVGTLLKKIKAAQIYNDLYEQGLQQTISDIDTKTEFNGEQEDDEIQWFFDILSDIWFETDININWRNGKTNGETDFLNSPRMYNESEVQNYSVEKVTGLDIKADGGRFYQGYCKEEIYEINKDYTRRKKEKKFYHLASEFDCCSNCNNKFPTRIYWSEQSFQEELTDNYRTFLPNNYIDIQAETGEIVDTFVFHNNFYILTEEALFHLPQNLQERVTGDIVTYIGTGEFFNLKPRKIIDSDSGLSAGSRDKWSVLKIPSAVYYVSENEGVIYEFNGKDLKPITAIGEFHWSKKNVPLFQKLQHQKNNNKDFPFLENPSNPFGVGYISTFDSRKNRIIFTKRDFEFDTDVTGDLTKDYEICTKDGKLIVFRNYSTIIRNKKDEGWRYTGIRDCKMQFEKDATYSKNIEITTEIPNDIEIHIFYDVSGSFGGENSACIANIKQTVDTYFNTINNIRYEYFQNENEENWVRSLNIVKDKYDSLGIDYKTKKILILSFINEASPIYHDITLDATLCPFTGVNSNEPCPTNTYNIDRNSHINLYNNLEFFLGILYPIAFSDASQNCADYNYPTETTRNFLSHSIGMIINGNITQQYINDNLTPKNPAFTDLEWQNLLVSLSNNPYINPGLGEYGWTGKWNVYAPNAGNIINADKFKTDLDQILATYINTELIKKDFCKTEYLEIEGEEVKPNLINRSFTKSFSLNTRFWKSYHSYLPRFYFFTSNNFYAWEENANYITRFNSKHKYNTYSTKKYPFIIDYISNKDPLQDKIFEYVKLNIRSYKYIEEEDNFLLQNVIFNNVLFYNDSQISGVQKLELKLNNIDYILEQTHDKQNSILVDYVENDYALNEIRDYRIDYTKPMFIKNIKSLQSEYFIDQIVNTNILDVSKNWQQIESFRDKYLGIRLSFDTFDDVKIILNYSEEYEHLSIR